MTDGEGAPLCVVLCVANLQPVGWPNLLGVEEGSREFFLKETKRILNCRQKVITGAVGSFFSGGMSGASWALVWGGQAARRRRTGLLPEASASQRKDPAVPGTCWLEGSPGINMRSLLKEFGKRTGFGVFLSTAENPEPWFSNRTKRKRIDDAALHFVRGLCMQSVQRKNAV